MFSSILTVRIKAGTLRTVTIIIIAIIGRTVTVVIRRTVRTVATFAIIAVRTRTVRTLFAVVVVSVVIKESIENYTKEKNQNIKKTMDIEMKPNMQVEKIGKTLKENKINDNEKIEKELFKNITDKIKQEIQTTVQELKSKTKDEIVEERYQKFRKISGFKEV